MKNEPQRHFIQAAGAGRINAPPGISLIDFYRSPHSIESSLVVAAKQEKKSAPVVDKQEGRRTYFLRK